MDKVLAKSVRLPPRQRALALSAAGFVQFAGGDQARARRLLKQSLPLYRQAGDRLGMGLTAAALGHLLAARHQAALASDLLEQTLIQLQEMAGEELTGPERVQHQLDVALASNFLGQIKLDQEDHHRAAELFADGLTAARGAADRFTILVSLYDLALSRQARGDLPSATDLLGQGLSLAAEAGDEPGLAYYSRRWPPSPSGRTSPSAPPACSPRPTHCLRPRAAAGCTPTCREPRTTTASWPGSAPAPPTPRSSKPGRTAAPSLAPAPCGTPGGNHRPTGLPALTTS